MRLGIIIGIIAIIVVAAAGGYLYLHKANFPTNTYKTARPSQNSAFSSIAEALSKNLSLKCDYTDNAQVHTVAYIKNGEIRTEVTDKTNPSQSGNAIIKDKTVYYWNAQNMGFKMTMPDVTVTPSATPTGTSNGQNTLSTLEQYKQYCSPAVVDDSLFVLPSNVTFTDQTQMMHAMPSVAMPTGASGTSQQQMQQYMQQYHVTPQQ